MRFAIIDNKLTEAQPGLRGLCPGCFQPIIAKCGAQRIYHWSHHNTKICDSWYEPETEWHRSWKNNFPPEWQEIFLPDGRTGENHIADVRTSHGLVIEFQHSHLDQQERTSREQFYKNMVWVVDGTRLKRDHPRFLKAKKYFQSVKEGIFHVDYPEECFPLGWLGSSVPVIFDFQNGESGADLKRNNLYCLFPIQIGRYSILAEFSHKTFVNTTINGEWILRAHSFLDYLTQTKQAWQNHMDEQQRIQDNLNFERFSRAVRYHQRRPRF